MRVLSTIGSSVVSFATVYSTPKVVQVQNKKIAIFNRLVQLVILLYVIGYVNYLININKLINFKCLNRFMIVYKKGYQASSSIESALVTKIKVFQLIIINFN